MNNDMFPLFLNYHKFVRNFLKESLHLRNLSPDRPLGIHYSTPSRAFAKFIVPVINGSNLNPTVTYYMTSSPPAQNQTPGGYFKMPVREGDSFKMMRNPLPYTLTYRITIWTTRQADSDYLAYQAMTSAPFNHRYAKMVDGQWGELEVRNLTNETNLEPGDVADKTTRIAFDIYIPRAYLPLSYEEYNGIIKETDIDGLLNDETIQM